MNSLLPPPTEERQQEQFSEGGAWYKRVPCADLGVLIASGAYLAMFFHVPLSSPDEGLIATAAERIMRGQIPYRDFFSELGPGSFYLQAAIFKLGGTNLFSVRLTAWSLGTIISWLIFRLGRQLMSGPAAFLPSLAFATTIYPRWYQISHHWWSTLFFLLTVLCLSSYAKRARGDDTARTKYLLVVSGLLAGAAALCMQSKGFWAVVMGIAWIVLGERLIVGRTWRDALRRGARAGPYFLAGVGVVAALMAGYFWAHGAFREWAEDNLVFLFTNYWPYERGPSAYSWTRLNRLISWLLRERSQQALFYVVGHYFFCLVGPAIAYAGAVWQIARPPHVEPSRPRLLLLFLLGGLGSFMSELHAQDPYHLILSAPLMFILLVYSCLCAYRHWPWSRWPLRAIAGVALLLLVLASRRALSYAAGLNVAVPCRRGTLYRDAQSARVFQEWIDAIENVVPPGGETFIFAYDAHLYFLTGTRNPTRYDVLYGMHSPQQIGEAVQTLQSRGPEFVFSFDQVERLTFHGHLPTDPPDILELHPVEKALRAPQSSYRLHKQVEGLEVWSLRR